MERRDDSAVERSGRSSQYAPLIGDTSPLSRTAGVRGAQVAVPGRGIAAIIVVVTALARERAADTGHRGGRVVCCQAKSGYGIIGITASRSRSAAAIVITIVTKSLSSRATFSYLIRVGGV